MIFGVAVNASIDIKNKTYIIHDLFNDLSIYFSEKKYGKDINEIIVGITCIAPEFERFHLNKKPCYISYKEYFIDGIKIVEEKLFTYSFSVDYECFKGSSEMENRRNIAYEIIESLENLEKIPKKVKDFNREKFKSDLKIFLNSQGLLDDIRE